MTVTGVTTAAQAGVTYAPPFQSVSSAAPAPLITGTVTNTPIPSGTSNPTLPSIANDLDFVNQYLGVHQLSTPSYRYAVLLWIIIALLSCIYALFHHVRYSGGFLGAVFSRWTVRKKSFSGRAKKSSAPGGFSAPSETTRKSHHSKYSNGALLVSAILIIFPLVLCVVGADYIAPSSSIFAFAKRAAGAAASAPQYLIDKSFWTAGGRFGLIAFALMPLVVLFALKSPPIAIFSLRPFTHLFADKLAALHRTSAWLVWVITTVHVALWTVQLFQDTRGDGSGRKVWFFVWLKYRFIFGAVAYFCFTAVMVLSLRPVRKHQYEFFYIAHVVFVFLTLVCSAIHHPPLWYWMAIALALWILERLFRAARFAKINGVFGKSKRSSTSLIAGTAYGEKEWTEDGAYRMDEIRPAATDYGYQDQDLRTASPLMRPEEYSPSSKQLPLPPGADPGLEFGQRLSTSKSYYDEGSMHAVGSYDSRITSQAQYGGSLGLSGPPSPGVESQSSSYFPVDGTEASHARSATLHDGSSTPQYHVKRATHNAQPSVATVGTLPYPGLAPQPIPVGYCQAQLLPSKTVRLTVRVARPFNWAPGQSVLLFIPDLSRTQSHPFTILSVAQPGEPSEVVLLVKARKGLTLRLFDLVRARAMGAMNMALRRESNIQGREMQAEAVFLRTWLDGPMGSAGRVRWGDHSSVLLICGGSGVSFGAAVCSWVVAAMAARNAGTTRKSRGIGRNMATQRVRFCWIVREWAEISWVAAQLKKCLEMVPSNMLQIDIFVTNTSSTSAPNSGSKDGFFAPPKPLFAKGEGSRRGSVESISSQLSVDSNADFDGRMDANAIEGGSDQDANYIDVVDLTNYEDEEDVHDEAEKKLSSQVAKEGKVRRARSRKAARRSVAHPPASPSYPPSRPDSRLDDGSSSDYTHVDNRSSKHLAAPVNDASRARPPSSSNLAAHAYTNPFAGNLRENRESFRSIADSTYARYDPYGGPGLRDSPSASMYFDDGKSVMGDSVRGLLNRASQTQSMIMLEEAAVEDSTDPTVWINQGDFLAMNYMAEHGRSGKPKLAQVFQEELEVAKGSIMVASCGPVQLNTVVRNLVAKNISPARVRHGDRRGHIHFYSEDYES